ncbi:MAG: LysE family translocator [Marivita sp.]|uniref:LysE family translocator n=1 Tax=Marivita sp. TaxID=2003365 RepID=UPI0025C3382D|nr:LysE family translocator [Marivita sp.]MCI5112073.1 LysE family translocator [Marivita sp.]
MTDTLLALLIFLVPLAYSPGPGNMLFAANGVRFGFRATLSASIGYHLATWIVTMGLGLGLLGVLETWPMLLPVLKSAGAVYVLWLALKHWRAGPSTSARTPRPASFIDGVMLLLLNPKAYVIIALMFSQFLSPTEPRVLTAVLLITTVFTLNNLVAFSTWTLIGDRLARAFRNDTSAVRLNRGFAALLVGVAAWMLLA